MLFEFQMINVINAMIDSIPDKMHSSNCAFSSTFSYFYQPTNQMLQRIVVEYID